MYSGENENEQIDQESNIEEFFAPDNNSFQSNELSKMMINEMKRNSLYDAEVRDSLEKFAMQRINKKDQQELEHSKVDESDHGDSLSTSNDELVHSTIDESPASPTTSVGSPTARSPGSYSPSRKSAKRMQKKKQKYRDMISPAKVPSSAQGSRKDGKTRSKILDALSTMSDHTPKVAEMGDIGAASLSCPASSSPLTSETSQKTQKKYLQLGSSMSILDNDKTKKRGPTRSPTSVRMQSRRHDRKQLPTIAVDSKLSETKLSAVRTAAAGAIAIQY